VYELKLLLSYGRSNQIDNNIPDEDFQNIQDGWTGMYFGALREFYEE
jgi:hypothetical protein